MEVAEGAEVSVVVAGATNTAIDNTVGQRFKLGYFLGCFYDEIQESYKYCYDV